MKSVHLIPNDYTVALRRVADGTIRSFDVIATHAWSAVTIAMSLAGTGWIVHRVHLPEVL
jgi:hypothetical protein